MKKKPSWKEVRNRAILTLVIVFLVTGSLGAYVLHKAFSYSNAVYMKERYSSSYEYSNRPKCATEYGRMRHARYMIDMYRGSDKTGPIRDYEEARDSWEQCMSR